MDQQTKSILILLIIMFFISFFVFFKKRKQGNSKAMATSMAVITFGLSLAASIFLGFIPLKSNGIGLERIVIPVILIPITLVLSTIVGMIVHLFEHNSSSSPAKSPSVFNLLQDLDKEINQKKIIQISTTSTQIENAQMPMWNKFVYEQEALKNTLG